MASRGRQDLDLMSLSLTGCQIGSLSGASGRSSSGVKKPHGASPMVKVPNGPSAAGDNGKHPATLAQREKSSSMNSLNLPGSSTQFGDRSKSTKPSIFSSRPVHTNSANRDSSDIPTSSKHSNDFLPHSDTSDRHMGRVKTSVPKTEWYGRSPKPSVQQGLATRSKPAWLVGRQVDEHDIQRAKFSSKNFLTRDVTKRLVDDVVVNDEQDDDDVDELDYLTSPEREESSKLLVLDTSNRSPEMNNRSSMALSPSTKMAFVDIENAYQNITHKTPVNQVHGGGSGSGALVGLPPMNGAEDFMSELNHSAAIKIQRWFRRKIEAREQKTAVLTNTRALKRLLEQKREEHGQMLRSEERRLLERLENDGRRQEQKRQQKEKKAKQQRQYALQDLKNRRSVKNDGARRIAEMELADLEAKGKLTKAKSRPASAAHKSASPRTEVVRMTDEPSTRLSDDCAASPARTNQRPAAPSDSESSLWSGDGSVRRSSAHRGSSTTTMDDIFATLKQLEADERLTESKPDDKRKTWLDELNQSSEYDQASQSGLTKAAHQADDKQLNSIYSFLDQIDTEQRISQIEEASARTEFDLPVLMPSSEQIMQMEEASRAASDVTTAMLTQRMELEQSKHTVQMLQKALNQQRELTMRLARETDKEMNQRLLIQKAEYEETIKRHLGFIDQLIDDKKSLSEKCETLVCEMKTSEKKYTDKLRLMQESHDVELRKLKDIHAAAEKLRREKWIEEKTKKIKEMTVKGLEPEIQRLIAKHKVELKKLKSLHEAELLESDERAGQRYVHMTEELRDQLHAEKEAACSRERELSKQRYEKQVEQEEESYQLQRRRLYAEVEEEKERINSQASKQRAELDSLRNQLESTHSHSVSVMRQEYEKARDEQERRHAAEIKELQERLRIEKEAWEENYMKKQETWILQKERELKERARKDRDKEIEMVIDRLESDTVAARDECERLAENKIKRIRDKYESEFLDLERSERMTMERNNEMKARLTEVEGNNEQLKVLIKQKEREKSEVVKMMEKLNSERDRVSDIIRQEFADRLVVTDEENKRLKNDMFELKARHRVDLENAKGEMEQTNKVKEEELEEVHKRVKQAIAKKEEVVHQLRQQYEAAMKRADHLEGLLEQQRKQLLKR